MEEPKVTRIVMPTDSGPVELTVYSLPDRNNRVWEQLGDFAHLDLVLGSGDN